MPPRDYTPLPIIIAVAQSHVLYRREDIPFHKIGRTLTHPHTFRLPVETFAARYPGVL